MSKVSFCRGSGHDNEVDDDGGGDNHADGDIHGDDDNSFNFSF